MESSPFKIERFDYLCSKKMKRAIIIGATSGIGKEVAQRLLSEGWQIGIAGRRQSALEDFRQIAPEQIKIQSLDVTQEDSAGKLDALIHQLGGMDLFLLSSGIGFQNMDLKMEIELNTARTNVEGFTRMVDTAFSYFKNNEADTWLSSVRLPELKVWELPLPILQRSAFRIHTSMLLNNSPTCKS